MIILRYTDFRYRFQNGLGTAFDGLEPWDPVMVRANGFDDGITGLAKPITAFPSNITIVGADGPSAYDWYLSQRTDEPSRQFIAVTQPDAALSGAIRLSLTALCVSELGLASATAAVSEDELRIILNNCYLYCLRTSDRAIQVFDLLNGTLGV